MYKYFILVLLAFAGAISIAIRVSIAVSIIGLKREMGWNDAIAGHIQSAFFYGILVSQAISGRCADYFGGKLVLVIGCSVWTLFNAFSPIAARGGGIGWLLVARVMAGMGQGVSFPCMVALVAQWFAPEDHIIFSAILLSTPYAGSPMAMATAGPIWEAFGWDWVFYVFSIVSAVWMLLFILFGKSPLKREKKNKFKNVAAIAKSNSDEETNVTIVDSSPDPLLSNNLKSSASPPPLSTLIILKRLFSSRQAWAIIIATYCQYWCYTVMLLWLPRYFQMTFQIPDKDVGLYSVLPNIVPAISGIGFGVLAKRLVASRKCSILFIRKLSQSIGMFGGCIFVAITAYAARSSVEALIGLTLAQLCYGFVTVGVVSAAIHNAPRNSGLLFSLGNMAGIVNGSITNIVVGYLLETYDSWNAPFALTIVHFVLGGIVWLTLWNDKNIEE